MELIKEWGLQFGITGIILGIFIYLFKEVISKNIFPTLTKKQAYIVLMTLMILVFSFSTISIIIYSNEANSITVYVHGEMGDDDLILTNRGKVKLFYGDAINEETINSKGEVTFKEIPSRFFNSKETVRILFLDPGGEPYRAINPDSLYYLTKGESIFLEVKLYGLEKLYGTVSDFEDGKPIDSVRISIMTASTYSDIEGDYLLSIPEDLQRKTQTIRARKDGYEMFTRNEIPIQTIKEFPILMKRIKN